MKKFYFLLLGLFLFNGANAQTINFPDVVFKYKLTGWGNVRDINGNYFVLDANSNGEIEVAEALNVYEIKADGAIGGNIFSDVTGIEYFTNVIKLDISNNYLTNLNVSALINLQELKCISNDLTNITLTGLVNLKKLECTYNLLTNLSLDNLTSLQIVYCSVNNIPHLNVSNLPNLQELWCGAFGYNILNGFKKLTLSNLPNLTLLECATGGVPRGLNELNIIGGVNNLQTVNCSLTGLTTVDVSMLPNLQLLNVTNCYNLVSVFAKNGSDETVGIGSNQFTNSLRYICADEMQLNNIQSSINSSMYITNCHVDSYCSFVPGGQYYTIQGQNKYDNENDGCDANDGVVPNLKYSINNGITTGTLISNATGNYSINVPAGSYTITPIFENPSYFTVSPTNLAVNFPSQTSPFIQNFCISLIPHHDVEVSILPMIPARPGFDSKYKIVYKNKGNQVENGSIAFNFDDTKLDYVSADEIPSQATGALTWNYTNLQPFETKEITVTLNVNSPTETPAVNNGDILNYTTTIVSATTDETPNDNAFAYNQTVVNSFDPNDKTCLEGATITPAKVGEYVHYIIRFENTGTYPAENIVVKDMIDTAKFDINSMVPIKGSHSFVTNITSGNKVEFIFENINLPFDDANNDGYVAFKIKTKPTLVLGNTFSNTASIYFDYNFPIVTNTATTTIAVLATQDFEFSNYFSLYPNPVKDILNIAVKETIEITSINIYNTLGQLVLVIPNAQKVSSVDVLGLTAGNYFIKINSDKGTSNTKFIKN
jgi:hypothetical protein